MSRLELFALGTPRIQYEGEEVGFHRDKHTAPALLTYLAIDRNEQTREYLQNQLWPEENTQSGQAKLRQTLNTLRTDLPGESHAWIESDNEKLRLRPDADVWFDATTFDRHVSNCRSHKHPTTKTCSDCATSLEAAVKLYRDDFMQGFGVKDSANFDDWRSARTMEYKEKVHQSLKKLINYHQKDYNQTDLNWQKTIDFALRLHEIFPYDELELRNLMLLHHWSGHPAKAKDVYKQFQKMLQRDEYGSPAQETRDLYHQIRDPEQLDAFIKVVSGKGAVAGTEFRIGVGVRIGRGFAENNINLSEHDRKVSRKHAQILRKEKKYWLIDKSKFGTKVNGDEIAKFEEQRIQNNDTIECGRTHMVFYEEQPTRSIPNPTITKPTLDTYDTYA